MSIEFTCSCGKHYKLIKQYKLMMVSAGVSEERVEQMVTELLAEGEEEGLAIAGGEEPAESSVATVQARTAQAKAAPGRNGTHEKATALPRTKLKPSSAEAALETLKGMNPQYFVALGVLVLIAVGYVSWEFLGGPASPATLEARALSAAKVEDRAVAATELTMRNNKETFPFLRRVATQSRDPEVLSVALIGLANNANMSDLPLYLGYLEHADQNVRDAAGYGLFKFFGQPLPGGLVYRANDPPEQRAAVKQQLEEMRAVAKASIKEMPR